MKDKLKIYDESHNKWRLQWYLADEDDLGYSLGEDPNPSKEIPIESEERDIWIADNAALDTNPERDDYSFYWESKIKAQQALRSINLALKQNRPLPDWAIKATEQGWKPPKGWKA